MLMNYRKLQNRWNKKQQYREKKPDKTQILYIALLFYAQKENNTNSPSNKEYNDNCHSIKQTSCYIIDTSPDNPPWKAIVK
ncbi:hypothetical protein ECSTECC16502_2577 [Escherichia coli STEC_C165-02]|nr:hypothetical protein ECSTECC16502_2577 [Escherichia coli STEC_C165-02]EID65977.1 hypothetical protein ECW26_35380 [Escherichia coli W26]